jgi:hypothetical protein
MRKLLAIASLAALVAAVSSCAAPLQNGGVVMRPGAEARLGLICQYRSGGEADHCVAPDEPEE